MFTKLRIVSATLVAFAAAGAAAVVPLATSSAATAQTFSTPSAAQTATLSAAQKALLTSSTPKRILMDPTTGDILSVTAMSASTASPDISIHNVCNTGDGCYKTNKVPYADQGFYGTAGTFVGSWPYRSAYSSGNYTVSACWTSGVYCGPKIGPNSEVAFTSDVTGDSFTIY